MEDLIKSFAEYPILTPLCVGILLLIGAITKGGINLGFVEIPKMSTKQSSLLATLGVMMVGGAALFAFKPWDKNNVPVASDMKVGLVVGGSLNLSSLNNIIDLDSGDVHVLTIVDAPLLGQAKISGDDIIYKATKAGVDSMRYQVSDGKMGFDTAFVVISVAYEEVDCPGKLVDVYGLPKDGAYNLDDNTGAALSVLANQQGEFQLRAPKKRSRYNLHVSEEALTFEVDPTSYDNLQVLEYSPIDSIQMVFSQSYYRSEKERYPVGVFPNRYAIPFDSLEQKLLPRGDGDSLLYGELCCSFKFFGSNDKVYSGSNTERELHFRFEQTDGEKAVYDSILINAGTSSGGWRTHLTKQLLIGEYELQIVSRTGKVLDFAEFCIK